MKNLFFLLVIIFFSCNEKNTASDEEIKDFLVQFEDGVFLKKKFLLHDSIARIEELIEPLFKDAKDQALSKADLADINQQIRDSKRDVWAKSSFDSAIIFNENDEPNKGQWNLNKTISWNPELLAIYSISKPYFSKDKNWCVFFYTMTCGPDCCRSETILYKKENGEWKAVNYYEQIVC